MCARSPWRQLPGVAPHLCTCALVGPSQGNGSLRLVRSAASAWGLRLSSRTLLLALGTWAADRRTSRLCCWRVPLLIRRKKQQQVGACRATAKQGMQLSAELPGCIEALWPQTPLFPGFPTPIFGPDFYGGHICSKFD